MQTKTTSPTDKCRERHPVPLAFTLLELLAILFTLSLLGGLLLPTLAKVRSDGQWTTCRNNMRQLGTAVTLYANENRDYLAFPNWDGGLDYNGRIIPGWLYTPTNGGIPDPGPGGRYSENPTAAYATGLWFPYVRAPRSYLCPAGTKISTYTTPGLRKNRLSTYVSNGAVCGFGMTGARANCRVTDVWNPGCYLLWEPDENQLPQGNPPGFMFNDGAAYPTLMEGLGGLHSKSGGEILCVGGQVQSVSLQRFRNEAIVPGKSFAWWSPFTSTGH